MNSKNRSFATRATTALVAAGALTVVGLGFATSASAVGRPVNAGKGMQAGTAAGARGPLWTQLTADQKTCLAKGGFPQPATGGYVSDAATIQARHDALVKAAAGCGITLPAQMRTGMMSGRMGAAGTGTGLGAGASAGMGTRLTVTLTEAQKACLTSKGVTLPTGTARLSAADMTKIHDAAAACGIAAPLGGGRGLGRTA